MSFKTPPAIQHRAWNLFLNKRGSAPPPPFDFPFFVAGVAGENAAIAYAFDPAAGFQTATIVGGAPAGVFRMLAVGPYAAYACCEAGIYETVNGTSFELVNPAPTFDAGTVSHTAVYLNGVFVCVIEGSLWRSVDGINWVYTNSDSASVCVHNGAFYASSYSDFSTTFLRSTDGVVWTPFAPVSVQPPAFGVIDQTGPVASLNSTLYVSVVNSGTTTGQQKTVLYGSDDDGATWTVRRTLLSVATAFLDPAASAAGSGLVYARSIQTGRHINTGAGFVVQNSPIGALLYGAIAARRGAVFECDQIGQFAISVNGGPYSGFLVPLDTSVNVA